MLQLQKRVFSDFLSQDITSGKARKHCSENYSEQHYSINNAFLEVIVQRKLLLKTQQTHNTHCHRSVTCTSSEVLF